jgi:NAD-dependent protein deacetylase/lipoamidase
LDGISRQPLGNPVRDSIQALRAALDGAGFIVVLTGAGISAESGIPTFRGADGLWRNFSPQELATPEAFERNPRLVWEWYDWRRGIIHKSQPNAGHRALAELERRKAEGGRGKERFALLTQNVDGLHERAGSRNITKLHGDIWQVRCVRCGVTERNEQVPLEPLPPRCRCGGLVRPGVVWFGEPLPQTEWQHAEEASLRAQVFLVVGTSASVYPAAGLAQAAHDSGARLAIVNPEATPLDGLADWVLRGPAGEVLPKLI